uniref:Uncharacterized protein n=1 Tax=viral metagenome TaxID=1070528 RepID=A0A6M3IDC0_9ZZZZ
MLIECLVRRDGPTPIVMGIVKYLFMPLRKPGTKSDGFVTSVCDITSEEHLKHCEKFPGTFRPYVEGQALPDDMIQKSIDLTGYAIEKTVDNKGYIVIDKVKKMYVGVDGNWKPDRSGLTPFENDFAAYQWLKLESQFLNSEDKDVVHDKHPHPGRPPKSSKATDSGS